MDTRNKYNLQTMLDFIAHAPVSEAKKSATQKNFIVKRAEILSEVADIMANSAEQIDVYLEAVTTLNTLNINMHDDKVYRAYSIVNYNLAETYESRLQKDIAIFSYNKSREWASKIKDKNRADRIYDFLALVALAKLQNYPLDLLKEIDDLKDHLPPCMTEQTRILINKALQDCRPYLDKLPQMELQFCADRMEKDMQEFKNILKRNPNGLFGDPTAKVQRTDIVTTPSLKQ